jgi:hypothetical protein
MGGEAYESFELTGGEAEAEVAAWEQGGMELDSDAEEGHEAAAAVQPQTAPLATAVSPASASVLCTTAAAPHTTSAPTAPSLAAAPMLQLPTAAEVAARRRMRQQQQQPNLFVPGMVLSPPLAQATADAPPAAVTAPHAPAAAQAAKRPAPAPLSSSLADPGANAAFQRLPTEPNGDLKGIKQGMVTFGMGKSYQVWEYVLSHQQKKTCTCGARGSKAHAAGCEHGIILAAKTAVGMNNRNKRRK